jgi:hypothetical protein
MLVKVKKTASGYMIESDTVHEALPDNEFWAELKLIVMPTQDHVADEETPAAKLHAILGSGYQPYPVDKEDYLAYLEAKHS